MFYQCSGDKQHHWLVDRLSDVGGEKEFWSLWYPGGQGVGCADYKKVIRMQTCEPLCEKTIL